MDAKDKLIEILEGIGYPVYLQGSLAEDQPYPETFFTFWNNSSDGQFYDNDEWACLWDFDVNVYSTSPNTVNECLLAAKAALKARGFLCGGRGYDLISGETTHTGRGINVRYREIETHNN